MTGAGASLCAVAPVRIRVRVRYTHIPPRLASHTARLGSRWHMLGKRQYTSSRAYSGLCSVVLRPCVLRPWAHGPCSLARLAARSVPHRCGE